MGNLKLITSVNNLLYNLNSYQRKFPQNRPALFPSFTNLIFTLQDINDFLESK